MEEESEDLTTPFWVQSSTNRRHGRRYNPSSLFLSSGFLVIFLLITALLLLGFVIPSILSYTSQIFSRLNNNVVKRSWNSLNIFLVLLAILFGFLSRNRSHNSSIDGEFHRTSSNESNRVEKSSSYRWYDDQNQNLRDRTPRLSFRRTSSSYPDLREYSSQWISAGHDLWGFYDDTQVDAIRSPPLEPDSIRGLHRRRSWKRTALDHELEAQANNIHVDRFAVMPASPPPPPPPTQQSRPAPPPQLSAGDSSSNRAYERAVRKDNRLSVDNDAEGEEDISISLPPPLPLPPPLASEDRLKRTPRKARMKRKVEYDSEFKENLITPPTHPPPQPPPLPPPLSVQQKSSKGDRKRHSATKGFLSSLYHKNKKKQRHKSGDNFDALLHQSQVPPLHFELPPPSQLPPPSVFHNLSSSKKDRKKKYVSVPARVFNPPKHKHPVPAKTNSFEAMDEASNSGGESPMGRIPRPPPPPPFRIPAWKFVVKGDFVRLQSSTSSSSGSPDLDDVHSVDSPVKMDGGEATFCRSADVNIKADSFISNFRAGLRLEKIISLEKHQELGLSNRGPGPSQT